MDYKDITGKLSGMGFELIKSSHDRTCKEKMGRPSLETVVLSKKGGLYFSSGVLKMMGEPEFVRAYINDAEKAMALLAIDSEEAQNDPDARQLVSKEKKNSGKQIVVRWTSKDIINKLIEIADIKGDEKKEIPVMKEEEGLFIVDFTKAQIKGKGPQD